MNNSTVLAIGTTLIGYHYGEFLGAGIALISYMAGLLILYILTMKHGK